MLVDADGCVDLGLLGLMNLLSCQLLTANSPPSIPRGLSDPFIGHSPSESSPYHVVEGVKVGLEATEYFSLSLPILVSGSSDIVYTVD